MRTAVAAAILLLLGFVHPAHAFVDDPDAAPLQGASRSLRVVIADLGPDAARSGLTPERLTGAVVKQLTAAGFRVEDAAPAAIHVGIGLSPVRGAGLVAYSVRYSFDQPAVLARDERLKVSAPTWLVIHTGTAFSAKLADSVLGAVGNLGERFHNSFDAVNPPGG